MPDTRQPDPLRGAAAGLAAGLAASLAMNLFQAGWAKVVPQEGGGAGGGDPATVKAANTASEAVTGAPVPEESKAAAGNLVHYGFGGVLGLLYGLAAEYRPEVTTGGGTGFGALSMLVFDEVAVPAAGLGDAPTETPASTHLYAFLSHVVFGGVAEGTRRLARDALD